MIRKIPIIDQQKLDSQLGKQVVILLNVFANKINELVDTVNNIQKEREAERFEIQEWIGLFEAVRKSVNVHEKQIDKLQMKLEPHKCEPAENATVSKMENVAENSQSAKIAQGGTLKCPVCGKDMVFIESDEGFNVFVCTNSKCQCSGYANESVWKYIDRTRKALEIATSAIDEILVLDSGKFIQEPAEMWKIAKSAKDKITALKQKD